MCIGFLSTRLGEKYHKSVGWAFFFITISGLRVFFTDAYKDLGAESALAMDNVSLEAFACVMIVCFMISLLKRRDLWQLENIFAMACFWNSIYTLYFWFFHPELANWGIIGNKSMNACFIAYTYPLLVIRPEMGKTQLYQNGFSSLGVLEIIKDLACIIIPIVAIIASNASIPILAVIGCWGLVFLLNSERGISNVLLGCYLSLIALVITLMGLDYLPNFTNNNGRFNIWQMILEYWIQKGNYLGGFGLGTTIMHLPRLQQLADVGTDQIWGWIHNDFLQTLFECGILGAASLLIMYICLVLKAYNQKKTYLVITAMVYGFTCVFNFNFHLAVPALFGVWLVARVFYQERP